MSELKKGALLSYISIFLTNIVGLILTPFIIKSLGNAEYGLYTLIGAFVSYISIMDFGLNNTIVRFIAKYRAEKDKRGEENFLATSMIIYVVISAVIVLIGLVLYNYLDVIFSNSLSLLELEKAKVMFIILVFNMAITLPGGAFTAICSGYERFVFPRAVSIVKYLVRALMVFGLLMLEGGSIGLVILDTFVNIIVIIVTAWYVIIRVKVKFKMLGFKFSLAKEIFTYSIWIFVFAIVQMFQWKSGHVILGINTNTISVAIFSVGIMLGSYYGTFAYAVNGLILPRAMQMIVRNESGEAITLMMIKFGRMVLFILGLVLTGFIVIGKDFILLWVGETYETSYLIALLVMLFSTIPLTQSFGHSVLQARNKIKIKGIFDLISMSIGVITGFYLSIDYGGIGMILCIVAAYFINTVLTNWYFIKVFDFKIRLFLEKTYFRFTLVLAVIIVMCLQINLAIPNLSWSSITLKGVLIFLIYCSGIYFFQLNSDEKSQIRSVFNK